MTDVDVICGVKTNISDLKDDLSDSEEQKLEVELKLLQYLWDHRGRLTVDAMSEATGWTRQTIYNKWRKHGFKVRNKE